jgi:hypothetical protein
MWTHQISCSNHRIRKKLTSQWNQIEANRQEGVPAPSDRHQRRQHGKNERCLETTKGRRVGAERLLQATATATAALQVRREEMEAAHQWIEYGWGLLDSSVEAEGRSRGTAVVCGCCSMRKLRRASRLAAWEWSFWSEPYTFFFANWIIHFWSWAHLMRLLRFLRWTCLQNKLLELSSVPRKWGPY